MIEVSPMELFTVAVVVVALAYLSGYYWGHRAGWKAWKKRGVRPEEDFNGPNH